jgi:uncharacterized protein (DUF2132 family)
MAATRKHQWRMGQEEMHRRMIVRALRRDPVVKRSNGTRDSTSWLADRIERGEIELHLKYSCESHKCHL